jgi:3-oxoacyl-[acyl-carrier protein] reductase
MKRFQDKIAVVTGSSRGSGAAIARAFAREGARVVITYPPDREGEEERARQVGVETASELILPLEVRDRESVKGVFQLTVERFGAIDILVNSAGIEGGGDFDQLTEEEWDLVLDTNLRGVFVCGQEVLPHMGEGGRVVNIGSASAPDEGPPSPSHAAAGAGVMALTHCMARFVGGRGITVNCVSPGTISSEALEGPPSNNLLRRPGTFEELAETVLFCAAEGSSYMTGQTIAVNGGLRV